MFLEKIQELDSYGVDLHKAIWVRVGNTRARRNRRKITPIQTSYNQLFSKACIFYFVFIFHIAPIFAIFMYIFSNVAILYTG